MTNERTIDELTTLLRRGRAPRYVENSDTLVLNQKCIRDFRCDFGSARFHDSDAKPLSDELLVRRGDVLVNSTGVGTLGRVAPLRNVPPLSSTVDSHVTILRPNPELVDVDFFGWSLVDKQATIEAMGEGATGQTELSARRLGAEITLHLPCIETQRRIAGILGAYEDLIEVNRRRVAVLQEMVRGLFEEWFVRFRFPGHERVPFVDAPGGPMPEGWHVSTLREVANINRASLKPRQAPEQIGYIDIASVSPGRIDSITWMNFSEAPGRARRLVQDGSVLWSNVRPNRRSHAMVLSPEQGTIASTGFTVLDAVAVPFTYLYQSVTTDDFVGYLVGNASGAAYPAVTAATFERAPILVPRTDLLERFGAFAEPLCRLAEALRRANAQLAASRDLLLPRLISGQLSVEAAESELEEAA